MVKKQTQNWIIAIQLIREVPSVEMDPSRFGRLNRKTCYPIKPVSTLKGNIVITMASQHLIGFKI